MKIIKLFAIFFFVLSSAVFSLENTDFPFYKELKIQGSAQGLLGFNCDYEIFNELNFSLANLRLFDSSKNEIPYYFRLKSKSVDSLLLNYPTVTWNVSEDCNKNCSYITIETFNSPIKKIKLKINNRRYYRAATIEGSASKDSLFNWVRFGSHLINSRKARRGWVTINLPKVHRFNKFRIKIDNKDDKPLKINNVKLFGPVYEVLFYLNSKETVSVYFGGSSIVAPNYDIHQLLRNKYNLKVKSVYLGKKKANLEYKKKAEYINNKLLFILAILTMVGFLSWLIIISRNKIDQ
jgi:hypothetical protein